MADHMLFETTTSDAASATPSVLDNPVLHSLTGAHRRFALTGAEGRAARYPASVSPFMALPDDPSGADWAALAHLAGPDAVALVNPPEPPPGWVEVQGFAVLQMVAAAASAPATDVAETATTATATGAGAAPATEAATGAVSAPLEAVDAAGAVRLEGLGEADGPAMLDLARRTRPGPFEERTRELGSFFGARDGDALVAMAGERLHPPGWTEISAVCTDESHRGRGLGRALMELVIAGIRERGETPFLHVIAENENAIRLYERMGFGVRRELRITVFSPPSS